MKKAALAIATIAMLTSCYQETDKQDNSQAQADENVKVEQATEVQPSEQAEAAEQAGAAAAADTNNAQTAASDAQTGATEQRSWSAADGEEFLKYNAKRPGVKTTPSGLQYEVLKQGNGAKPGPTDRVTVHYTGKLLDGTVFDSSVERGQPLTFGLNQVIPGWTEGLQLMPVGSKYRLYIPADLAYGANGAGGVIPPNAALIFDVELINIAK